MTGEWDKWPRQPLILVADDDTTCVALLKRILATAGYTNVISKLSGKAAIELALVTRPDVVILDLHMPGADGLETLSQISQIASNDDFIPILIVSGDTSWESRHRALSHGATDFITKPFNNHELILRITNMLKTRLLHLSLKDQTSRLEKSLKSRDGELEEARLEVLERLALAAELRDCETGRHVRNVGELSAAIALRYGVPPEMAEVLRKTAPLHDIGKIGVPDSTLLKKGPLSHDELVAMRDHTILGERLLAGGSSVLLQTAAEIARNHHEKWDGSGYPSNLSGELIPLAARIVAVADVYDALTHDRPYRKAWTLEAATHFVLSGSGTHFDPTVVDAFRETVGKAKTPPVDMVELAARRIRAVRTGAPFMNPRAFPMDRNETPGRYPAL